MPKEYYFQLMQRFGLPAWEGMTGEEMRDVAGTILAGARVLRRGGEDYELFRQLQVRRRWDWPATFSTNGREIWPFVGYGSTRFELRENVAGLSEILDEVARIYLGARGPLGGRFFVNESGGFWKDDFGTCHQFVIFDHGENSA